MLIRSIIFNINSLIEDISNPVFCANTYETLLKLKACNLRVLVCSEELTFNELTVKLMQTQLKYFFDYYFAKDSVEYEIHEFAIDYVNLHVKESLLIAPETYEDLAESIMCEFLPCNSPKDLSFSLIEDEINVIKIKYGVIETLENLISTNSTSN